jgi:membrane protein
MTPPPDTNGPPHIAGGGRASQRTRQRLDAARARYAGSWAQELGSTLKELDFFNWTMIFGAELLWSALPLLIILSSLANHRLDADLSRHIGLDRQGAHVVSTLFRNTPSHAVLAILTGLLFSTAGVLTVVASLQVIYERLFSQEHRGWRDLPRYVVWVVVLVAILAVDASLDRSERRAGGAVLQALLTFLVVAAFFLFTMHFLLAGRVPWRNLVRPTLVSAVLWIAFGFFSSVYFSSTVIDDSKTYGTIGVVFTLLTWFIIIGYLIVLGAAAGAVWQNRAARPAETPTDPAQADAPGNAGRAPE